MIRVDQPPVASTLPLPVAQTENKSCCITNIALPIIAALAGFVFLPFEAAIALTCVIALGAFICRGCIDGDTAQKVSKWMPIWTPSGGSSVPMPREREPVDQKTSGGSSTPLPRPVAPDRMAPAPRQYELPRFGFRAAPMPGVLSGIPERESVDSGSSSSRPSSLGFRRPNNGVPLPHATTPFGFQSGSMAPVLPGASPALQARESELVDPPFYNNFYNEAIYLPPLPASQPILNRLMSGPMPASLPHRPPATSSVASRPNPLQEREEVRS